MKSRRLARKHFDCPTCGKRLPEEQRVDASRLRALVKSRMVEDFPGWDEKTTCRSDVHRYRMMLIREALEAERGHISPRDAEVLSRMEQNQVVARNLEDSQDARSLELGARVADAVAQFGGSWTFLGIFGAVILLWMVSNVVLLRAAFDPYPFILLNLVLSCLAAVQAPIIMMSQNRHAEKDRQRAEHDYEVNLKAELELQLLHEKVDHLMLGDWPHLLHILELQAELLESLRPDLERDDAGPPIAGP